MSPAHLSGPQITSLDTSADAAQNQRLRRAWEGDGQTLDASPRLRWEADLARITTEVRAELLADPARQAARVAAGLPADELTPDEIAYAADRARLRAPDPPFSAGGRAARGLPPGRAIGQSVRLPGMPRRRLPR